MIMEDLIPVFMLEVETGDIELIEQEKDLVIVLWENQDDLKMDFKFWDKEGHPVQFELTKKEVNAFAVDDEGLPTLTEFLQTYARKFNLDPSQLESQTPIALFKEIESKKQACKTKESMHLTEICERILTFIRRRLK
jgi:hypothetical protein